MAAIRVPLAHVDSRGTPAFPRLITCATTAPVTGCLFRRASDWLNQEANSAAESGSWR